MPIIISNQNHQQQQQNKDAVLTFLQFLPNKHKSKIPKNTLIFVQSQF